MFVIQSPIRVLIVDDNKHFRMAARYIVLSQLAELEITESADGQSAVDIAQDWQPDLILLDIGLPEMNGIEAATQIRQVSPSSKIVFVTQQNDRDVQKAALETGAQAYVLKMNAGQELALAIRASLDAKQQNEIEVFKSHRFGV